MWFPLSQFVSVSVIWAKLSRSTITHNKYPIYRVRQREYYRTVGENLWRPPFYILYSQQECKGLLQFYTSFDIRTDDSTSHKFSFVVHNTLGCRSQHCP
jgi:hypothetical protein